LKTASVVGKDGARDKKPEHLELNLVKSRASGKSPTNTAQKPGNEIYHKNSSQQLNIIKTLHKSRMNSQ
jgi:hypothetical protein